MPGGSVNGRPLREDPTSYSRTGVPRGSIERYNSTSVTKTTPQASRRCQQMEPPEEAIETESERQLQRILNKQLKTDMTIEEHKKSYKKFSPASVYKPLGEEVKGELSLEKYHDVTGQNDKREELRQYGLTDSEIDFKLLHENGPDKMKKKSYGMDPLAHKALIESIEEKIEMKKKQLSQPDQFSDVKVMSRHEMDLELALSHDKGTASIMGCLVKSDTNQSSGSNHRINIDILNEQLTASEKDPSMTETKKRKFDVKNIDEIEAFSKTYLDNAWTAVTPKQTRLCPATCLNKKDDTKKTVRKSEIKMISADEIKKNRLSNEEIRLLPRFTDYQRGEASQVLYIKNMPKSTSEEDLWSLFKHFDESDGENVEIRLLSGRMRGQAFVTFQDVQTATDALNLINGYKLRDKPLIIQFGNQKKACES